MTTTYQTFGRNPNFDRDWLEKDLIDEIRPWLNYLCMSPMIYVVQRGTNSIGPTKIEKDQNKGEKRELKKKKIDKDRV